MPTLQQHCITKKIIPSALSFADELLISGQHISPFQLPENLHGLLKKTRTYHKRARKM